MSHLMLVLDAGNTNVCAGVFDEDRLAASWRLMTIHGQTVDEFTLRLGGLFQRDGISPRSIGSAILASVVPPVTETLRRGVEMLCGLDPLVVRPGVRTGMKVLMDRPEEVGADRIVNSVAAWERVRSHAIVVDFGTATTFDCISQQGDYVGGVICPGLVISAEALFVRAARLPRVDIMRPPKAIGRSTVAAIQSGLFHGYAGLVDGVIDALLPEMPPEPRILATGGLAELIAPGSRHVREIVPDLTLEGLRLIRLKNP
jgi:type III pantothenate kinase